VLFAMCFLSVNAHVDMNLVCQIPVPPMPCVHPPCPLPHQLSVELNVSAAGSAHRLARGMAGCAVYGKSGTGFCQISMHDDNFCA